MRRARSETSRELMPALHLSFQVWSKGRLCAWLWTELIDTEVATRNTNLNTRHFSRTFGIEKQDEQFV